MRECRAYAKLFDLQMKHKTCRFSLCHFLGAEPTTFGVVTRVTFAGAKNLMPVQFASARFFKRRLRDRIVSDFPLMLPPLGFANRRRAI